MIWVALVSYVLGAATMWLLFVCENPNHVRAKRVKDKTPSAKTYELVLGFIIGKMEALGLEPIAWIREAEAECGLDSSISSLAREALSEARDSYV